MNFTSFFKNLLLFSCFASQIFFSACEDDDPVAEDVPETITTTILTFTPSGGGSPLTFKANDPDGDGPEPVTLDDITLSANTSYTLTLELLNELLEPADEGYNITAEVEEEGDEHQFFYSWTNGLFSDPVGDGNIGSGQQADAVNYEDKDENNLPIGLETTWDTGEPVAGTFRVVLKHQPDIKSDTSGAADGESDMDYTFDIEIQ